MTWEKNTDISILPISHASQAPTSIGTWDLSMESFEMENNVAPLSSSLQLVDAEAINWTGVTWDQEARKPLSKWTCQGQEVGYIASQKES